jgi:nucleotide-binding universal stress UspA family protein
MVLRRLVVGVDFSDVSLSAARWVSAHFAPEAEIVLVHAAPNDGEDLRSLTGGLAGVANLLGPDRVRAVVRRGAPADVLARVASEVGADLVCVGRSRLRTRAAHIGATTNDRLLARSSIPTVIIPAGRQAAVGQVFVAVADAPGAERLVGAARALAAASAASVRAFHFLTWADDAGQAIVRAARLVGADLVVLGRGSERTSSIEATARFVASAAPCPVLLLPAVGRTNDLPEHRRARRDAA